MKHLLDVNILLAAILKGNAHHSTVMGWLIGKNVVLCPICELGFLRISSNRKIGGALAMDTARHSLEQFAKERKAERIPDDLNALESHPKTSDQVTDHYLADLAQKHGLKLATLDGELKHPSAVLVS